MKISQKTIFKITTTLVGLLFTTTLASNTNNPSTTPSYQHYKTYQTSEIKQKESETTKKKILEQSIKPTSNPKKQSETNFLKRTVNITDTQASLLFIGMIVFINSIWLTLDIALTGGKSVLAILKVLGCIILIYLVIILFMAAAAANRRDD